jgi:hypothetical protein
MRGKPRPSGRGLPRIQINGRWPTKAEIQALIVGMKKMEGTEWISDIPAHALLTLADDLHKALLNWFNSLSGKRKGPKIARPRFRGKFARQFSVYMVNQNTSFGDGLVKLPKLGPVKFRGGELPAGRLLSSRVYREADKWYMSPRWPLQIPPPVATPNSPRQDRSDYDDCGLMAMRAAASLRR